MNNKNGTLNAAFSPYHKLAIFILAITQYSPTEQYNILGAIIVVITAFCVVMMYRVNKIATGKKDHAAAHRDVRSDITEVSVWQLS